MEVTQDLARVRVLHQVDDGRLAARNEHGGVAVQPFIDHRTQRTDLIHCGIICPEGLGARISCLVATKMHDRIRSFIDMRLGSVRGYKHEVITSLDQGHRRNNGLVEIISSRTGTAALHLNASGIGTEHKDFALGGHLNFSFFPTYRDAPPCNQNTITALPTISPVLSRSRVLLISSNLKGLMV